MMLWQFDNLDFNGPYGPYDLAKAYIKQRDTSHDSWHVCVCVCMLGDKRSELLLHELLLVVVDKLRNINQHHEHHIQSSSILT